MDYSTRKCQHRRMDTSMSESQELWMHVIGTERYRSKNEKFHQAKPSPLLELSDTEVESS